MIVHPSPSGRLLCSPPNSAIASEDALGEVEDDGALDQRTDEGLQDADGGQLRASGVQEEERTLKASCVGSRST